MTLLNRVKRTIRLLNDYAALYSQLPPASAFLPLSFISRFIIAVIGRDPADFVPPGTNDMVTELLGTF